MKTATKRTTAVPAPPPATTAGPVSVQLGRRPDLDELVQRWQTAAKAQLEQAAAITAANRATREEAKARQALATAVGTLSEGDAARFEAGAGLFLYQPTTRDNGPDWEAVWSWLIANAPPEFRRRIEKEDPRELHRATATTHKFVRL